MTPLRFASRPVGLEFLDEAPLRWTFTAEVAAPPERVWHELADDASTWPAWFPYLKHGSYEGVPGVGAKREVALAAGSGRFQETILAFDEARRYTWRVDSASLPAFATLVEDWSVAETATGSRVTWTFACEPRRLFKLVAPLAPRVMQRTFNTAARNLEARIRNSSA